MSDIERLVQDAKSLKPVSESASNEYRQSLNSIIDYIARAQSAFSGITDQTGKMFENMNQHNLDHGLFMTTVFKLNCFELLARSLPWVYRVREAHHVPHELVHKQHQILKDAVAACLTPASASEVNAVYDWVMRNHEEFIRLSKTLKPEEPQIPEPWQPIFEKFFSFLREGDTRNCVTMAQELVGSSESLQNFYLNVLQPSMYRTGQLWEDGEISVADEHLISSIVTRVMTAVYNKLVPSGEKGRAVITSSPNEFHQIGAWMVSDFLEMDGWKVKFLGSDTPLPDLLNLLRSFKPDLMAVSVTIGFNLGKAREIIASVRKDPLLRDIKIMLGGQALNPVPGLWKDLGADGVAKDAHEAVALARKWSKNK